MAHLDQDLCGKKERVVEREIGGDVFKCLPNRTNQQHQKSRKLLPQMPFCNTPKNHNLHHQLHYLPKQNKYVIILRDLCGLFRPLPWSEIFHRETGKQRKNLPTPSLSLFLSLFCCHIYLYHIVYFSRYKPFSLLPIRLSSLFISNAHTYFLVFLSLLSHLPKIYKYIDRLILFEIINFS